MPLGGLDMLNSELAEEGTDAKLQRMTGGTTVAGEVTVRAFDRGYATELIGANGLTDQHVKIILSPSEIIAAGWTSGRPSYEDVRVPMKGNRIVLNGRVRNIESARGFYEGADLVRIEARAL